MSVDFQDERWERILQNWERKNAKNAKCLAIGYMNLDFVNWENPLYNNNMIERKKVN